MWLLATCLRARGAERICKPCACMGCITLLVRREYQGLSLSWSLIVCFSGRVPLPKGSKHSTCVCSTLCHCACPHCLLNAAVFVHVCPHLCCRLREGVEVVVGTPGRIIDFVESGKLGLDSVSPCTCTDAGSLLLLTARSLCLAASGCTSVS